MNYYDFKAIRRLINKHRKDGDPKLVSATIGMGSDWYWTAVEVWSEEHGWSHDLNSKVAGITGSTWATPELRLTFAGDWEKSFTVSCDTECNLGKPVASKIYDAFA